VNPLQQTFRCHLPEVAADRVLRKREVFGDTFGNHLAVSPENIEDQRSALGRKHAFIPYLHEIS
jgi:hypothetical protein